MNRPTPADRMAALQASCRAAGLVCLDDTWLGAIHRYRFRCAAGHEWLRRGDEQRTRPTCPLCVRSASALARRKTSNLLRLHDIAQARGGALLSDEYIGVAERFRFRCAAGHEWETQAITILGGGWCKPCHHNALRSSNLLPDGLERLQRMAREKGGECLSTAYVGSRARYRFRCAQGHEWDALGHRFVEGTWCRTCDETARQRELEADAHRMARARGGQCLGSQFINSRARMSWLCHRGHQWVAPVGRIREGHWCPECAHMALISNRKSKARARYKPAGTYADVA